MEIQMQTGKTVVFRPYQDTDLEYIQELNMLQGWTGMYERKEETKRAWETSNVAFTAVARGEIAGFIRGLTDGSITLFICEILIKEEYRSVGLGRKLLEFVHAKYPSTRMEMLAASDSRTYYEGLGFRPFYGFRRTFGEIAGK